MNGPVIVATRNQGKVREMAELFGRQGLEVKSLADFEGIPEMEETGSTFAENALLKARTVAELLKAPVLADDSGLEVEALDGRPGVRSARYAGEDAGDGANNAMLQRELADKLGTPDESVLGKEHPAVWSRAAFVCSIVLCGPEGEEPLFAEGRCEGYILAEPRGGNGFGYDPYFYLPGYGRTMAELSVEEKNRISHRALALRQLIERNF